MPNVACPVCGTEYAGWSVRCPSCGTALGAAAADLDLTQVPDEEKVVYELGGWPLGVQAEAAQVMAESGVPHLWDDTDLVVHLDDEAQVDALLEEVEREAVEQGLLEPSGEADADGDAEIVYDLADWGEADRARLDTRLDEGGVPHVWEGTALVVAAADEALVEELLDAVEHPDALAPEPDDTAEAAEDEVRHELLSDLFDAADRLKRDATDERAIDELAEVLAEADAARPPYGFPAAVWRTAVGMAEELGSRVGVAVAEPLGGDGADADGEADAADGTADDTDAASVGELGAAPAPGAGADADEVEGEPADGAETDEGPVDPEAVAERLATQLRDLLRPYV